ncbi:FAD-dependent oxidoreductase [Christiangramia flava]|uniref:Putative periplasmic protein-TrxB n=1 Tax=Christiangramia flava JLT2011 TaxID=1229726 RepID=A0A1L7I5B4_9FLAO|nr:FAD-dependent oxidoreductase [Christiangramia flava]APU68305.1 Putative periplasmic protein-TrxB [Christiangramia flava JLT2011]OSS40908.1 hypothetical protein C723_0317 [Christiangramia flava JLT2011]
MQYDVMIIGGGVAGISCALVLGSGLQKSFGEGKRVGIVMHQKASHLQSAKLYNAFGIIPGKSGAEILLEAKDHLREQYPGVDILEKEKVKSVTEAGSGFKVQTNKADYEAKMVVIATGYNSPNRISGLEDYVIPHTRAKLEKNRIELKNQDHLVKEGLYVAGTLAGWRSQFSIAAGSGAAVATDILTVWNGGEHTKVHDKLY